MSRLLRALVVFRGRSGFSLIELLMVVVVSTMGFVALFGMQTASLRGLNNTKRILEATNLAENFIEELRVEFMAWTENPGEGLQDLPASFPHLADLPTGPAVAAGAQTPGDAIPGAPGWVLGDEGLEADRRVSVVGDPHPLGLNNGVRAAMLSPGFEGDEQPFCLHYRLTWLIPNRAIRAEVEVSWATPEADMDDFVQCDQTASSNLGELRSVTMTSTLPVNVFQR